MPAAKSGEEASSAMQRAPGHDTTLALYNDDTPALITAMDSAALGGQEYDLLFLVDATASMGPYLDALNQALPQIIALSKLTNCFARIGILAYRDYDRMGGRLLEWSGWLVVGASTSQPDLHQMARELRMYGGRSWPEAIKTGLARAYELMRADAKTIIMLFADAPPHFDADDACAANTDERAALRAPDSYSGCGPIFADWVKGTHHLRGSGKTAQVVCVVNSSTIARSGAFEYIAAVTGGACIHPEAFTARNLSQIAVDVLLTWMGVKKDGAAAAPLLAKLSRYVQLNGIHSVKSEDDPLLAKFIGKRSRISNVKAEALTIEALEECLVERSVPVQDLSKTYHSEPGYRSLVATELRNVIESDVTTMSLNPVFGSLWRTFCNDRSMEGRQAVLDLFGSKIEAISDSNERARMKAWLDESYDYSAEVLATIASVSEEDRFPCVCLDPTLRFTLPTGTDEDTRPITEFTRDELLEIGRSCDWRVLKRLGQVLTRLTFINSAAEMPAHIAATSDAEVPKIPLALALREHKRQFWGILLHIVVPGTKLGGRAAALVAALTIRLGVTALMKPAVEQMLLWRDRWNNLDVPETWSLNCLSLILDADRAYKDGNATNETRHADSGEAVNESTLLRPVDAPENLLKHEDKLLFERLIDYKLLELNLSTTLHAKVTWTVEHTVMPVGRLIVCKSCKFPRSVSIMAENGLCGICAYFVAVPEAVDTDVQRGSSLEDTEDTPVAWFECNLSKCRAQYVVCRPETLNVKPKCHYCRENHHEAPVVQCIRCLGKVIWPKEYREGDMKGFVCVGCETGRKTVVEVETTADELRTDNGTDWLVHNEKQIGTIFAGLSMYKTAVAASPLDTFSKNVNVLPVMTEQRHSLSLGGRRVQNTDALISELRSWVSNRRTELGTCSLCFSDKRKNDLFACCGRSGCNQRVCKECLDGWYGLNAPGRMINTAALHCAFCRRSPTAKTLARNGSGVHAVRLLKAAVEDSGSWIYAWCIDCGEAKQFMERVCARGLPEAVENWACEICEEAKLSTRKKKALPCPSCGIMTEKSSGCDHMKCVCGAHWCFFCGEEQNERTVYSHMSVEHGGYYGGRDAEEYEEDEEHWEGE